MSSLRRILSLECTDNIHSPLQQPLTRKIARHSSLPILSFYNPQVLPSLPLPSSRFNKARHGTCSRRVSLPPPSCGLKPDNAPHRFASFRSVPAWSADDGLDSAGGQCTITWSISRKESLDMENSVVYRELCDSIRHLELPCRYERSLGFEAVSGSVTHDEGEVCEEDVEKKRLDSASFDVRERPLSLRMLKRKALPKSQVRFSSKFCNIEQGMEIESCDPRVAPCSMGGDSRDSLLCDVGGSVNSAFSSLVFMMESLQQHSLWLRRVLISEADARLHVMMAKVHQEMQETLLWLFQKVFSCTPKLMLLTMMLLVDFAVHSMGEHVALAVMPMGEPPTCAVEMAATSISPAFGWFNTFSDRGINVVDTPTDIVQGGVVEPRLCEGGAGDTGVRTMKVGGSMDGEAMPSTFADRAAMTVEDDSHGGLNDVSACGYCTVDDGNKGDSHSEERRMVMSMWQQAASNRHLMKVSRHMLVAPVQAPALEADDYPCFDRTDLTYQHELSRDPSNPLLLANYAQFLHLVRHDHPRAEELYKRAVKADPVDGEVMGKYASFLWVAKEDVEGADEAYKAAMAVDPSNAYHAGSYAHFLWNSNASQDDNIVATASYQQVSTT